MKLDVIQKNPAKLRSAPCKLNNEKHEQTPWTIKVLKKEPKELFSECQK